MRRFAAVTLILLIVAGPSFAKMHKDTYSVPCTVLWNAVKDTLRHSEKYGILGMENSEMTATYSVLLNTKGDNACEMQVQSSYSGFTNDDAGDFKKRVDKSLAQSQAPPASSAIPAGPESPSK